MVSVDYFMRMRHGPDNENIENRAFSKRKHDFLNQSECSADLAYVFLWIIVLSFLLSASGFLSKWDDVRTNMETSLDGLLKNLDMKSLQKSCYISTAEWFVSLKLLFLKICDRVIILTLSDFILDLWKRWKSNKNNEQYYINTKWKITRCKKSNNKSSERLELMRWLSWSINHANQTVN